MHQAVAQVRQRAADKIEEQEGERPGHPRAVVARDRGSESQGAGPIHKGVRPASMHEQRGDQGDRAPVVQVRGRKPVGRQELLRRQE